MKNYKVKRLVFIDSTISTGQTDQTIKPSKMEIVGFVVDETSEYITLATEIVDGVEYRGQVAIPKVAIEIKPKNKT